MNGARSGSPGGVLDQSAEVVERGPQRRERVAALRSAGGGSSSARVSAAVSVAQRGRRGARVADEVGQLAAPLGQRAHRVAGLDQAAARTRGSRG